MGSDFIHSRNEGSGFGHPELVFAFEWTKAEPEMHRGTKPEPDNPPMDEFRTRNPTDGRNPNANA